jgi:hypothetical protein
MLGLFEAVNDRVSGTCSKVSKCQHACITLRLLLNKDGSYAGIQKLRGDLTLNQTQCACTSQAQAEFYDAAGYLMMPNPSTSQTARLTVQARPDPTEPTVDPNTGGS